MDQDLSRLAALRESIEAHLEEIQVAAGHIEDEVAQLLGDFARLSEDPTLLSDEERTEIEASARRWRRVQELLAGMSDGTALAER